MKRKPLPLYLLPEVYAALKRAAASSNRKMSNLVETTLAAYLKRGGFLKKQKRGKRS
jgi:hypothetical protein